MNGPLPSPDATAQSKPSIPSGLSAIIIDHEPIHPNEGRLQPASFAFCSGMSAYLAGCAGGRVREVLPAGLHQVAVMHHNQLQKFALLYQV